MAQERWEEAIPWLEQATTAPRYESPQFPFINLGRVYERLGRYRTALEHYNEALALAPWTARRAGPNTRLSANELTYGCVVSSPAPFSRRGFFDPRGACL